MMIRTCVGWVHVIHHILAIVFLMALCLYAGKALFMHILLLFCKLDKCKQTL